MTTPGLAERIGRLAQDQSQRDVLQAFLLDNGVQISVSRLRPVATPAPGGLVPVER